MTKLEIHELEIWKSQLEQQCFILNQEINRLAEKVQRLKIRNQLMAHLPLQVRDVYQPDMLNILDKCSKELIALREQNIPKITELQTIIGTIDQLLAGQFSLGS